MPSADTERRETADGYAFTLDRNRVSPAEVGEWIALEQRCCPFFDFRVELGREKGALTLALGGWKGVKEFIAAEFAAAF
ncbi:MAG TPA: hypothetical protein VJ276_15950 [Thermoanaerobaculia bacterium]|nr:hypothetical protein [Thermoanaerobaculia bacterium]